MSSFQNWSAKPQSLLSKPLGLLHVLPQGLLSKPLSLLRVLDLAKYWVMTALAATERARARLWQDQRVSWGTLVPDDTIAVLLGLVSLPVPILATLSAQVWHAWPPLAPDNTVTVLVGLAI
jgi:hypothetical protein